MHLLQVTEGAADLDIPKLVEAQPSLLFCKTGLQESPVHPVHPQTFI